MKIAHCRESCAYLAIAVAGIATFVVGCSRSSESSASPVIGEPATDAFKDRKLTMNGREVIGKNLAVSPREEVNFNGSFHFVKPGDKKRLVVGSVVVRFTFERNGSEITAQGSTTKLNFLPDGRASFSCKMIAPSIVREYTVKVTGTGTVDDKRRIIMETKVRVKE